MKTLTLSEANRNFSLVTEEADKEGNIILTRHGKEAYVVMDIKTYEKEDTLRNMRLSAVYDKEKEPEDLLLSLAESGIEDVRITQTEKKGDRITFITLLVKSGTPEFLTVIKCSEKDITFEKGIAGAPTLHISIGPGVSVNGIDMDYINEEVTEMLKGTIFQGTETIRRYKAIADHMMNAYKNLPANCFAVFSINVSTATRK